MAAAVPNLLSELLNVLKASDDVTLNDEVCPLFSLTYTTGDIPFEVTSYLDEEDIRGFA